MPLLHQTTTDGTPLKGLDPESNKRVLVSCNRCGNEYEVGYKSYIAKQREYRRNGETYCQGCSNIVSRGNRKLGPAKGARAPGPANPNFNGGRFVASDGHVMVLIAVGKYQREDVLLLEKQLGRPINISSGERILHVDLNKTNNAIENLVLLPTEAAYRLAKKSLQQVTLDLLKRGLVQYDTVTNAYVQSEQLEHLR